MPSSRLRRKRTRRSISCKRFLPYVYSAFSERSPCAAASATAAVTRGRSSCHSRSSSSRSRLAPSGVMYFEPGGVGGRYLDTLHQSVTDIQSRELSSKRLQSTERSFTDCARRES